MKRLLPALAAVAVAVLTTAAPASATNTEKVWICHGLPFAASHDYNLIHVSVNAVDGEGQNDHTHHVNRADRWDDIIPAPNEGDLPYCPDNQTPPTTTTSVPPSTTTTTVPTVPPPVTTSLPPIPSSTPGVTPPAPSAPTGELAATGATEVLIALFVGGAALLGVGAVASAVAYRRRG